LHERIDSLLHRLADPALLEILSDLCFQRRLSLARKARGQIWAQPKAKRPMICLFDVEGKDGLLLRDLPIGNDPSCQLSGVIEGIQQRDQDRCLNAGPIL
jgi:hypothetical protein